MRVTDSMIAELNRSAVAAARERTVRAQGVASTGMRVAKPSDDPRAAAFARRKLNDEARIDAMLKTANTGAFALQVVDDSLVHMGEMLDRAQELAIQAANATTSAADRVSLGNEVAALRTSILGAANARADGKYILGGLREDAPPFDATGAFVGDRQVRQVELAPGVRVDASVSGGEVLAPAGGLDVLAALDRLGVALAGNDLVGIHAGIDDTEAARDQVVRARSAIGLSVQSFDQASALGTRMRDRAREVRSAAVEADAYDSISELTQAQSALERAVAIASRLPLPGLAQKG